MVVLVKHICNAVRIYIHCTIQLCTHRHTLYKQDDVNYSQPMIYFVCPKLMMTLINLCLYNIFVYNV